MKTSERILAYCAVVITLVAIAVWINFPGGRVKTESPGAGRND